ncbi:hypothetical protein ACJJTC_019027 [Scirpophaga incertulas]
MVTTGVLFTSSNSVQGESHSYTKGALLILINTEKKNSVYMLRLSNNRQNFCTPQYPYWKRAETPRGNKTRDGVSKRGVNQHTTHNGPIMKLSTDKNLVNLTTYAAL